MPDEGLFFKIKNNSSQTSTGHLKEFGYSAMCFGHSFCVAQNINEGFSLLLISAILFAIWGYIDKRWTFLALQFFYASSALIGLIRWA